MGVVLKLQLAAVQYEFEKWHDWWNHIGQAAEIDYVLDIVLEDSGSVNAVSDNLNGTAYGDS